MRAATKSDRSSSRNAGIGVESGLHKSDSSADIPQHEAFTRPETLTREEGQSNNTNTAPVMPSQVNSVGYVKTCNAENEQRPNAAATTTKPKQILGRLMHQLVLNFGPAILTFFFVFFV